MTRAYKSGCSSNRLRWRLQSLWLIHTRRQSRTAKSSGPQFSLDSSSLVARSMYLFHPLSSILNMGSILVMPLRTCYTGFGHLTAVRYFDPCALFLIWSFSMPQSEIGFESIITFELGSRFSAFWLTFESFVWEASTKRTQQGLWNCCLPVTWLKYSWDFHVFLTFTWSKGSDLDEACGS